MLFYSVSFVFPSPENVRQTLTIFKNWNIPFSFIKSDISIIFFMKLFFFLPTIVVILQCTFTWKIQKWEYTKIGGLISVILCQIYWDLYVEVYWLCESTKFIRFCDVGFRSQGIIFKEDCGQQIDLINWLLFNSN